MAKGYKNIEDATARSNEARERAAQNALPQLYTTAVNPAKGGTPVFGRVLEQGPDVNNYGRHEYQVPDGKGGFYRRQFTCLKESPWLQPECPGCTAGIKLKVRAVYNVIQRNRPVFRKGQDGKAIKHNGQHIVDGYADQVVIWDVPSTTGEALRQKDGDYHGLMGLDLKLSYSNNSFQPWNIEPADIVNPLTPMSENDQALAASKHNLDDFMKPPSYQEAAQIVAQYGANSGAQQQTPGFGAGSPQGNANQAPPANGFLQGAQVPQGQPVGSAFGAAQQVVPPPATVPPLPPAPEQAQPQPAPAPPVAAPPPPPAPVQQ